MMEACTTVAVTVVDLVMIRLPVLLRCRYDGPLKYARKDASLT